MTGARDRWKKSFYDFMSDMGHRPSRGHSIDRINNDGNYEPGNCRWATKTQQTRNMRKNRVITIDGVTKTAKEWAIDSGLNYMTFLSRIYRGETPSEKTTRKAIDQSRLITYAGETMTATDWARKIGCDPRTLFSRLKRGWGDEEAVSTPIGVGRQCFRDEEVCGE
jgi:hypothetical protein